MSSRELALLGGVPVRGRPFPPWPAATTACKTALLQVLESGLWWQGEGQQSQEFESWLASYQQARGALAVTNGTHAIELALRGLRIGPGMEVLVPSITFVSTAYAVSAVGAVPVPFDVRADNLLGDVADAAHRVTPRTRGLILVHLAGQPADCSAAVRLCTDRGLKLLEDCAQAVGSEWAGRRVGGFGAAGTFSFQAGKVLSAGEGGALVSNDARLLETLRLMANCGRGRGSASYAHSGMAGNYRMSEFQAALLTSQRALLDEQIAARAKAAARLADNLRTSSALRPAAESAGVTRSCCYMFLLRIQPELAERASRDRICDAIRAEGVPCRPIYPPWQATPAYRASSSDGEPCRVAEADAAQFIWLPHNVLLDPEAPNDVANVMDKLWARRDSL